MPAGAWPEAIYVGRRRSLHESAVAHRDLVAAIVAEKHTTLRFTLQMGNESSATMRVIGFAVSTGNFDMLFSSFFLMKNWVCKVRYCCFQYGVTTIARQPTK